MDYWINVSLRQLSIFYRRHKKTVGNKDYKIIGIIRERNESLLLEDTLDHLASIVDGIVVFDDASTDDSVAIAMAHPAVVEVIENRSWRRKKRAWEETSNRKKLHDVARSYSPEWLIYADADERFDGGDIRDYLLNHCPDNIKGVRVSLFDAYMTKNDNKPYERGKKLLGFRKYFGVERRDILMMWRNSPSVDFLVADAREPQGIPESAKELKFYSQHYGKAISEEQWEETCRYYMKFFPKYSKKWKKRLGRAIHEKSDFETELYTWRDVKSRSIRI